MTAAKGRNYWTLAVFGAVHPDISAGIAKEIGVACPAPFQPASAAEGHSDMRDLADSHSTLSGVVCTA
jgi:hypothetical protein